MESCQGTQPPKMNKREATLAFIEAYRSLPELWDKENRHYSNRVRKAAAYAILIEKLKVLEPDASRESVVKKINNLRSTFRKEFKKRKNSKRSGTSADDLYVPSLWYYNELLFLVDQETSDKSLSTVGGPPVEGDEDKKNQCTVSAIHIDSSNITGGQASFARPLSKRMKKHTAPVSAEHLISLATSYLQKEDDECLIMAKVYAAKMKKLTPDQLIFADRVITETLVEAQMGKLTRWTSLSTHTSPFSYDQSDDTRMNN